MPPLQAVSELDADTFCAMLEPAGPGLSRAPALLLPYAQAMRQGRRWWMSGGTLNLVIAVLVIILLVVLILQFV